MLDTTDNNSKVVAQTTAQRFAAMVRKYPKPLRAAADTLIEHLQRDPTTDGIGTPAPKGFFKPLLKGDGYKPEIRIIASYLFNHWNEQIVENESKDISKLVDACTDLKSYLDDQAKPILNEFTDYYLNILADLHIGNFGQRDPENFDAIRSKILSIQELCKKALHN